MPRPKTNTRTLYRLIGVDPTPEGMLDALDYAKVDEIGADPRELTHEQTPAVWIAGAFDTPEAAWCHDATQTTGFVTSINERDSAGLLLIAVDDVPYAIAYGRAGWRLIDDQFKDPRFGLSVAARRLNPERVRGIVRRRPGARGRTDSVRVPGGSPVWALGVREQLAIVGRLNGEAIDLDVTFAAGDRRPVQIQCGTGLTMRLGVIWDHLVADIRKIARICDSAEPIEALSFIDHLCPITYHAILDMLNAALDEKLGTLGDSPADLVITVPSDLIEEYENARGYTIKIGSGPAQVGPLDIPRILTRTRRQPPGRRVEALRRGRIVMCADEKCTGEIGGAAALKWIEAEVDLESRRFFLIDGKWYEIDETYLNSQMEETRQVFPARPSVDLTGWHGERTEHEYCGNTQIRPGFLSLDWNLVRSDYLRDRNGFEACDILGPHNELIHVKFARGSDVLSHLFLQGAASACALWSNAEARAGFADVVRQRGRGRTLPPDFRPTKVIFAILPKTARRDGKPVPLQVTPDNLFPLAHVALANATRELHGRGIKVEVVGIPVSGALDTAA